MTGKKFSHRLFFDGVTDYAKVSILGFHPSYYKAIRGEIKVFVQENWANWNDEKPDWFDSRLKATIPEDMIPTEDLKELRGELRKEQRRKPEKEGQ